MPSCFPVTLSCQPKISVFIKRKQQARIDRVSKNWIWAVRCHDENFRGKRWCWTTFTSRKVAKWNLDVYYSHHYQQCGFRCLAKCSWREVWMMSTILVNSDIGFVHYYFYCTIIHLCQSNDFVFMYKSNFSKCLVLSRVLYYFPDYSQFFGRLSVTRK